MAVTIRDVARQLNLSITTVSRALDGYDDVAEETRQQVILTARQMGYSPNRAARQLRRRKSDTIGFILPAAVQRIAEPFFMEFIAGLGDELATHDYDLLVANAASEQNEHDLYRRWVDSRKVDGIILNRICLEDWRIPYLNEHKTPFASLERATTDGNYPSIQVDGSQGYLTLLQHLKERGFQRLAFIGGHPTLVEHANRLEWIQRAADLTGMILDPATILTSNMTSTGGYQAACRLFAASDPPDAVLCIDDSTAFGALHAAHEQGLVIGQAVGIAGFDGTQESLHTQPPLTTLDIPIYDMARRLVRMLMEALGDRNRAVPGEVIVPELRVRASTGGSG